MSSGIRSSAYPSLLQVDMGDAPGWGNFVNFGESLSGGITTTRRLLWPSLDAHVFPPGTGTNPGAGIAMFASSSSANDTAGGTGLRVITVNYLDTNYNTQFTDVTLNGQTPVQLTPTNICRINGFNAKFAVGSTGSAVYNQGYVYIGVGTTTNGAPATKYSIMPPTRNNSKVASYTIPADVQYVFRNNLITADGTKVATYDGEIDLGGTGTIINVLTVSFKNAYEQIGPNLAGFGNLPPKSDVRWYAHTDSGSTTGIFGSTFITKSLL